MKVVVLGAGLMGKQAAKDLIASDKVEKVYLADVAIEQAIAFKKGIQSDKLDVLQLNANDDKELASVLSKADVAVNALFYTFNEKVAKVAIECGVHVVDLGGHIGGATKAVLALHEKAVEKGVTIIPDLGVAPGMINILAGYGAAKLDKVDEIKLFVGGIPVHPEPPLEYNHVFSLDGVFDHYTDPSYIIRDGQLLKVPSLSEAEPIDFEGFNELEAFYTSGGTSTLLETFREIRTLEYKTVRYKGHADKFRLLVDLGFTDRQKTVTVDGHRIKLRDVLREVLTPITELGDKEDAVVMRVIVAGTCMEEELAYIYDMVTTKDMATGVTAMARATAFTVSAVAQMIGNNIINKKGVYPPELIVPGEKYIEEMAQRGVVITEKVHYSTYQS
ncbi:saccharopine dehydrogenase C-terminal domain-containing protein [Planococcus sp. N028]|uniref:Saccharopine dehydrogenase C-terminal domain-containing protein n=1 Tax=Planococcus shixiaomingii TaxID=3058393 RepID=A0ABT8N2G6_9BACL|nr:MULTISPECIES: saccharopine dehydrogenase C-terminal domain-containing protein [unclassified Planococcus (in: firmicutes)]MDN7241894.1 saccharopine dehydrogenase C-terminal domain-containing protein [Planococcus sp. N028]WKA54179.1 saccharopine dehydrogenase C-terminal domain-containing protein [Planococcus sp. N022]